jgi:hypothetical protein
MRYSESDVDAATMAMEKYRIDEDAEVSAALVVVGLCAERAAKEAQLRDEMIRVAHKAGASLRQLAEVSGLGRKIVTAVVSSDPYPPSV